MNDLEIHTLRDRPLVPDGVEVHLLADLRLRPELLRPPVPVVERFAYAGRVTLMPAPRKTGKSTLAGALAASVANGRPFLGEPVDSGLVLWIAVDEPLGDLVRRLDAERAEDANVMIVQAPISIAEVVQTAKALAPRLLIVDTLSDLTAREVENENDALALKRVLEPFRQLAREDDLAILWLHHTNKATRRSRGSGVFEDMADLILHLDLKPDDLTLRTIHAEGRIPVDSFEVRWGESGFELPTPELSLIQRVRQAIWARPGASRREIRDLVTGRSEEIATAINRLLAAGQVVNRGSSSHAKLHGVENPGNHLGNHSANHAGTAWEQPGTTTEQLPEVDSGSPPLGGTTSTGTTRRMAA